MTAGCW